MTFGCKGLTVCCNCYFPSAITLLSYKFWVWHVGVLTLHRDIHHCKVLLAVNVFRDAISRSFYPDDEGCRIFHNIGTCFPRYTVPLCRNLILTGKFFILYLTNPRQESFCGIQKWLNSIVGKVTRL